jgi:hypothetical protein
VLREYAYHAVMLLIGIISWNLLLWLLVGVGMNYKNPMQHTTGYGRPIALRYWVYPVVVVLVVYAVIFTFAFYRGFL